MPRQIIQCLSCGRVRQNNNTWNYEKIDPFEKDISHTYCTLCIQTLQEKLLATRNFNKWNFSKQIAHLSKELEKQSKKHDKISLKFFLDEFYCIGSKDFLPFYQALKKQLVPAMCSKCNTEIKEQDKTNIIGEHKLHGRCYKKIKHKIQILIDNKWDKSNKLDAYLDLLRIEKQIRPAIKKLLENTGESQKTLT